MFLRHEFERCAYCRRDFLRRPDPAQRQKELEEELRELDSPFLTAEAFGVEDVIDPRDTRALLCRFIDLAQARLKMDVGVKLKSGVRP